jgi:hypothetical protein
MNCKAKTFERKGVGKMNKKIGVFMILVAIGCPIFVLNGCYEPTKQEIKSFEGRGWRPTTEAESEYLAQLKKVANIPENAKIENVSMYGGEIPRVVVYGETEKWTNYKGESGEAVVGKKIKLFDAKGGVIGEETISSISNDKQGNVSAFIGESVPSYPGAGTPQCKVSFVEEKSGDLFVLKEGDQVALSADGNYMMKNYVKAVADPKNIGPDLEVKTNKYDYMDRQGNILWTIQGGTYGFEVALSDDGSRVVVYNPIAEPPHPSGLKNGIYVFNKEGREIISYSMEPGMGVTGWNRTKLHDHGNYIVVPIDYKSEGKNVYKFLHILVNENRAFISDNKIEH